MPLSEKAKGKQRAIDAEEQPTSEIDVREEAPRRVFTVRFTEGVPDLELSVGEKDTIREVKRQTRLLRPAVRGRRLRLIHAGRLLTDGTFFHGWVSSLEARQKRATSAATGAAEEDMVWLHCSIGSELKPGEHEDDTVQTAQLTPLRGFDRLASAGFSHEEIAVIRRQFHLSRGLSLSNDAEDVDAGNADADEHARALEEQWIDEMDGSGTTVDNGSPGDSLYSTLLQGLLTGFFYPLLPLFFIRRRRPAAFFSHEYGPVEGSPNIVFSRRMQMALVVGLVTNIAYGGLRAYST